MQGMTLYCIRIFIVTVSFLYWYVMRPARQRLCIHSCIYLRILIISYLATFLGTNSLSVLMCRKAVKQSPEWTISLRQLASLVRISKLDTRPTYNSDFLNHHYLGTVAVVWHIHFRIHRSRVRIARTANLRNIVSVSAFSTLRSLT